MAIRRGQASAVRYFQVKFGQKGLVNGNQKNTERARC